MLRDNFINNDDFEKKSVDSIINSKTTLGMYYIYLFIALFLILLADGSEALALSLMIEKPIYLIKLLY